MYICICTYIANRRLYIYIYICWCIMSAAPQRRRTQSEALSGAVVGEDLAKGCPARDFAFVARAGGAMARKAVVPRRRIRGSPRGETPCQSRSGGRYPQELGSSPLPQIGVRTSHELKRMRSPPTKWGRNSKGCPRQEREQAPGELAVRPQVP